jgi:molybdopterin converting factor subunit 1
MIEIRYFASLRGSMDRDREPLDWPEARPEAALIEQLRDGSDPWSSALGGAQRVMIAINQELAGPAAIIRDGDEVALFPPVTGG